MTEIQALHWNIKRNITKARLLEDLPSGHISCLKPRTSHPRSMLGMVSRRTSLCVHSMNIAQRIYTVCTGFSLIYVVHQGHLTCPWKIIRFGGWNTTIFPPEYQKSMAINGLGMIYFQRVLSSAANSRRLSTQQAAAYIDSRYS